MKNHPKISVVMPNYNGSLYLQESISSILNQSYTNLEFIIVDDGSTDNSIEIINTFLYDDRVKVITLSKNMGNYFARNVGIEKSESEFIAVMDADDISTYDRLMVQYRFLSKSKFLCVGSQAYRINEEGKVIGELNTIIDPETLKINLLRGNYVIHPTLFFNRRRLAQSKIFGYNHRLPVAADYEFVIRCALNANITNLGERLIYYRNHSNQITEKRSFDQTINSRNFREMQIAKLQVRFTKEEMSMFNKFMEDKIQDGQELDILLEFLNRIIIKNAKVRVYDEEILYQFFNSRIRQVQLKLHNNLNSLYYVN